MKVQIDSNGYLTGGYCNVGDIDNSMNMDNLPDCEVVYYPAYKILSKEVEEIITVMEEVPKQRPITFPILDEEGNDTGETETKTEEYTEIVPVEKVVTKTEYYYELDEAKKAEIDDILKNPIPEENKPTEIDEINQQITDMQLVLCDLYELLGGGK